MKSSKLHFVLYPVRRTGIQLVLNKVKIVILKLSIFQQKPNIVIKICSFYCLFCKKMTKNLNISLKTQVKF